MHIAVFKRLLFLWVVNLFWPKYKKPHIFQGCLDTVASKGGVWVKLIRLSNDALISRQNCNEVISIVSKLVLPRVAYTIIWKLLESNDSTWASSSYQFSQSFTMKNPIKFQVSAIPFRKGYIYSLWYISMINHWNKTSIFDNIEGHFFNSHCSLWQYYLQKVIK